MAITDRTKDVIKSGGEWISSIELENTIMGHPAVAEAAVIGVAHPKWTERPLLIVVKTEGQESQGMSCSPFTRARSPSGGSRRMSSSSQNCRIPRQARSRRLNCASNSQTIS